MFPVPARKYVHELLDEPDGSFGSDELAGTLSDIRAVNRRLGGIRASLGHLQEIAGDGAWAGSMEVSILDVASGSADIPVEMVGWTREAGIRVKVVALDISRAIVSHAARHAAGCPEIRHVVGNGLMLPFRERSFDIVHCSMALHHFSDREAGLLLSEIARVARRGYIVCDLRRSWVAYALIYLLTRMLTKNRLTRYDGPVSVLRSFTPSELSTLAARAGLEGVRIKRHPFWRMALVGEVS